MTCEHACIAPESNAGAMSHQTSPFSGGERINSSGENLPRIMQGKTLEPVHDGETGGGSSKVGALARGAR
jgi:hypothetical protein